MTVVDVQLLRVGDLSGGDRRGRIDDLSRVLACFAMVYGRRPLQGRS
jgi:hypothetical protein